MKKLIVLLSIILYCLFPPNFQNITTLHCQVDPDYNVVVGDGQVRSGTNSSWDTVHDLTDGYNANYTASTADVHVYLSGTSYQIYRGFVPIDTSGIPDGATITAAVLNINGASSQDLESDAYSYIVVVQASQASTTELVTEDYDEIGSTAGSNTIAISDWSTGNNAFTLTETGRGWISKTGVTKLGLREGHDLEDVAPDQDGYPGTRVQIDTYETASAAYLSVTYTTDGDTGNAMMGSIWALIILGLVFIRKKKRA